MTDEEILNEFEAWYEKTFPYTSKSNDVIIRDYSSRLYLAGWKASEKSFEEKLLEFRVKEYNYQKQLAAAEAVVLGVASKGTCSDYLPEECYYCRAREYQRKYKGEKGE